MKNPQCFLIAGVGLVFLLVQSSCSTRRQINRYSGDGEIEETANPVFARNGYTVKFEPFMLDHPAHLSYHFTGLPNTGRRVDVCFAISGPHKWERRDYHEWYQQQYPNEQREQTAVVDDLKGVLAMSLKDTNGSVFFEFERNLSEFPWRQEGLAPPELSDPGKSHFTADSGSKYVLEVTIDPDPILKNDEGYVLLRSGVPGK